MLPMRDHVPYSSGASLRVIIREKSKPVMMLAKPTTMPIRPEYVTLISLKS